jgi:hypothetical protein
LGTLALSVRAQLERCFSVRLESVNAVSRRDDPAVARHPADPIKIYSFEK